MTYTLTTDDITLVEGCLAGQELAWECLISKYERLIYATCRKYNLHSTEADDIFGRVCLVLLQNLDHIKDRTRLSAWLITTTSRECWHYRRKQKQALPLENDPADSTDAYRQPESADDALLPEEILVQLEQYQELRQAFDTLGDRCQQLIWYLFYDPAQRPYTEIAARLELPVSSIGPNRARCLDKLRREFHKITGN